MFNFLKGRLLFVRICLLASALALFAIGVATIYAVGHPVEDSPASEAQENWGGSWKKQFVFGLLGVAGFVVVNLVNYRRFGAMSYWIFAAGLAALAILLIGKYMVKLDFVPVRNNAHRWIVLPYGLPNIQPSEFFKLAYILTLAWYLRYRSNYRNFRALIGPFALTILPMVMILLEPDLGTVMLMMPVLLIMLFTAGARGKHILIVILMAVLISPLLWTKMKTYQRIRISSVLLQSDWVRDKVEEHKWLAEILVGTKFSESEWKGDWGYQLIRSKYAVASGGLKGYGFRQGPFVKYDFLGERHNDFIFAVIAEQWGFWGCLVLFGLYIIFISCGLEIAANNTDPFGRLLAVGIVVLFVVEVLINVGMTIGIMPITGLTLPLVSYGGSSLLVSITAVGLLNNIGRCRPFSLAHER